MKQKINYITPAVTPFLPNGEIDFSSLERLYDYLIDGGVNGILVLGSIGEFFGLTVEQKKSLIAFAAKHIHKRVELIVGTTSMVFDEITEISDYALNCGADAVMIIPPYYFHFTAESIYDYYDKLAEAIKGNLYLYNFPDRTGYEIPSEVVGALAKKHKNIIGIKDTISGVDHTREIIKTVKAFRNDFLVYSGFDDNFAHNVLCGGNGCIAGLSNLYPKLTSSWVRAARAYDFRLLQTIQQKIDRLMDIYAVGKPFVPYIKEAMVEKGIIDHATATIPMPKASKEQREILKTIMTMTTM